jgi:hypothetical protein
MKRAKLILCRKLLEAYNSRLMKFPLHTAERIWLWTFVTIPKSCIAGFQIRSEHYSALRVNTGMRCD